MDLQSLLPSINTINVTAEHQVRSLLWTCEEWTVYKVYISFTHYCINVKKGDTWVQMSGVKIKSSQKSKYSSKVQIRVSPVTKYLYFASSHLCDADSALTKMDTWRIEKWCHQRSVWSLRVSVWWNTLNYKWRILKDANFDAALHLIMCAGHAATLLSNHPH